MQAHTAARGRKYGHSIGLLAFILSFVLGSATAAAAHGGNTPTPQVAQELRVLAERALQAQYTALTNGSVLTAGDQQHLAGASFQRGFSTMLTTAKARREFLAQHNVGYTNFTTTVAVEKVMVKGARATLTLMEHTVFTLQPSDDPQAPTTTEFQGPVDVSFALGTRGWRIVSIHGGATGQVSLNATLGPNEQVRTTIGQPARAAPADGAARPQQHAQPTLDRGAGQAAGTNATAPTLNRSNIVNYALRHVFSPNPNYRDYSSSGGDCTNFASQALRSGGWYHVGTGSWSNAAWWYASGTGSSTWVNSEQFWWFTNNRPRAWSAPYVYDLQVGDILQADWNRDYIVDHTMIVTAKRSDGMPYLTYRSNNQKNRSFWDIYNSGHQNAWYYAWRLHDRVY